MNQNITYVSINGNVRSETLKNGIVDDKYYRTSKTEFLEKDEHVYYVTRDRWSHEANGEDPYSLDGQICYDGKYYSIDGIKKLKDDGTTVSKIYESTNLTYEEAVKAKTTKLVNNQQVEIPVSEWISLYDKDINYFDQSVVFEDNCMLVKLKEKFGDETIEYTYVIDENEFLREEIIEVSSKKDDTEMRNEMHYVWGNYNAKDAFDYDEIYTHFKSFEGNETLDENVADAFMK